MKKIYLSSNKIVLLLTLYFAVIFNFGLWQSLAKVAPFSDQSNHILWFTLPFFVIAYLGLFFILIYIPYIRQVLVPLLLIIGAATSYAVWMQKIYFDRNMIDNIFQTTNAEALAWITPSFILWVVITGVLPSLLYLFFIRVDKTRPLTKVILWKIVGIFTPLVVVAIIASFAYLNYASLFRNNRALEAQAVPTNVVGALIKNLYNKYQANLPLIQIGLDAKLKPSASTNQHKKILVLVVGETTRAQNWGLNPNAPATTPLLAKIPAVVNFQHVTSCGTATAVSVPCLFSNMQRTNYKANLAHHQENVLDILQRAGVKIDWYDNDGGCKGVCNRVKNIYLRELLPKHKCDSEGCYDIDFIPILRKAIDKLSGNGVIILHTIGSHGPDYFKRYPAHDRLFTPTCDTNQLQSCSKQRLENTYNNTVVAVDEMLAKSIEVLQQQPQNDSFSLLYFSDHGESLGEDGIYLHGTPYFLAPTQQTHIPMIFWGNKQFYQDENLSQQCLQNAANSKQFSQDNIFHSLLGIMNVETKEYKAKLDLFKQCRAN